MEGVCNFKQGGRELLTDTAKFKLILNYSQNLARTNFLRNVFQTRSVSEILNV